MIASCFGHFQLAFSERKRKMDWQNIVLVSRSFCVRAKEGKCESYESNGNSSKLTNSSNWPAENGAATISPQVSHQEKFLQVHLMRTAFISSAFLLWRWSWWHDIAIADHQNWQISSNWPPGMRNSQKHISCMSFIRHSFFGDDHGTVAVWCLSSSNI